MPLESKTTPKGLDLAEDGAEGHTAPKADHRQMCKYGKDCYQKNPMHHQKFRHPKPNDHGNTNAAGSGGENDSAERGDKENNAPRGNEADSDAVQTADAESLTDPPKKRAKIDVEDESDQTAVHDSVDGANEQVCDYKYEGAPGPYRLK